MGEREAVSADERRRFKKIHRETRYAVSLLGGTVAAGFTTYLARGSGNGVVNLFGFKLSDVTVLAVAALISGGAASFIAWPIVREGNRYGAFRAGIFAIVAVMLGCLFWTLLVEGLQAVSTKSAVAHAGDAIVWAFMAFLFLGWRLIPLALAVALVVAYWANVRLRRTPPPA